MAKMMKTTTRNQSWLSTILEKKQTTKSLNQEEIPSLTRMKMTAVMKSKAAALPVCVSLRREPLDLARALICWLARQPGPGVDSWLQPDLIITMMK
jgi:hypothetical protein